MDRVLPTLGRGLRSVLIACAVVLLGVMVFGRAVARFLLDLAWYEALRVDSVFWTTLRAKALLFCAFFVVFAVLAGANLRIADSLAPRYLPAYVHPLVERFHHFAGYRRRRYPYIAAAVLGALLAAPAVGQWQHWMLFRHHQPFGLSDEQFHVDIGFYVFRLPFLAFVVDWLLLATLLVLVLTVVAHVLNGSVVFTGSVPCVSRQMSAHVAVLLGALALLKGADYWVARYETTNVSRGIVQGPTYAVVHGELPALLLLTAVSVVVAALFFAAARTRVWRVPVIGSVIWLVLALLAGIAYPALVQSLVVRPNQRSHEAPFIANNVYATRQAMGIDMIPTVEVDVGPLSARDITADQRSLENIRLLRPTSFRSQFEREQGLNAGFAINTVDVDRYELDGRPEQVLVAARELDLDGAPNSSWQGRHLISTHGCGLVMAPASKARADGQPDYRPVELVRPELYFSPAMSGYAIVGTEQPERTCATDTSSYLGLHGVPLSSVWRRGVAALAFMDYNILGSGAITSGSQLLWMRGVTDRVSKLAPFLTFDGDPYPVAVSGGVKWVVDAYTSTDRYPAAEAVGTDVQLSEQSGIPRSANYVRNSVKAVVDAYHGTTVFYVMGASPADPSGGDPIIGAWRAAFPALFRDADEMPAALKEHLRYPEDLFRVQTSVYSKYQLDPEAFFDRDGAWSVAQNPDAPVTISLATAVGDSRSRDANDFLSEPATGRFAPYYTLWSDPGGRERFVLFRPFVPFSADDRRTELQAYMTASGDFDDYGTLRAYVITNPTLPFGPQKVASDISTDPAISTQITLLSRSDSAVVAFGDLQLVPVGEGLLWARPIYTVSVTPSGVAATHYRFMIMYDNGRASYAPTIGGAVQQLFPLFAGDIGELVLSADDATALDGALGTVDPSDPLRTGAGEAGRDGRDSDVEQGTGSVPSGPRPGVVDPALLVDMSAAELIALAEDRFAEADRALERRDLGTYQAKVDEAAALVAAAGLLLDDAVAGASATSS